MKKNSIICLLIYFFFNLSATGTEQIIGKAKVIDGDTIIINNKKIRFAGIDAPESFFFGKTQMCKIEKKKISCGNNAKEFLSRKIKNKVLKCLNEPKKDKYDRIIAECFVENESLSLFMVKNGHAFDYKKYSNGKFEQAEKFARKNKLGIWASVFEYPWVWRKKNK